MCLPMLGLVYVHYSPFLLDVSSPKRVSSHFSQSFFHVPSLLYSILYLQGALSKYCFVVWPTLFLLRFCTQTGGGALFLYAPHIICIYEIQLIPWSFFMLLFLSFAPVMRILMIFSWGQCFKIFSVFLSFFSFSVTFFANNYNSFIKWYNHFYLSNCFSCFLCQWCLFSPALLSPCFSYPFVCCCSHVACHSSFCFIINIFETF